MKLNPGSELKAACFLFDMDGTLIDSTPVVERVWRRWAERRGITFDSFRHTMHGRRAVDTMRDVLPPGADITTDLAIIDREELEETEGIIAIPGALELLTTLPRNAWALVTSAQRPLAQIRLQAAGLPWPDIAVTAEDIHAGKPDPECYRLALHRLGRTADQAIVFEDAPAGIAAGLAAGCRTLAVTAATKRVPTEVEWLEDFRCLEWLGVDATGHNCLRVR